MGTASSKTNPRWLVLNKNEDLELRTALVTSSSLWYPKTYNKMKDADSAELAVFDGTIEANDWSYYRYKMQRKTRNAQTTMKPSEKYFIIAEYHENTKNNIISEEIRKSLLNNLSILSKDKSIEYDIRNLNGSKYLYPKTNEFGKNDKQQWTKQEDEITTKKSDNHLWDKFFYDSDDDYIDPLQKKSNIIRNNKNNTAMIHDLIDPNKNTMDHKLWIPAIFNCKDSEYGIDSEIPNLDRIRYKSIYNDIGKIFFGAMKKSFENVLGRKLYNTEKIIVKSMKYLLNKPGDKYIGNIHREGMGENIIVSGIYYPSISAEIEGGDLELMVVCKDEYNYEYSDTTKTFKIKIIEGSMIVFSNECYHRLVSIEYKPENNDKDSDDMRENQLERIIIAFFLISPNAMNVPSANDDRLGDKVNVCYNSKYILDNWWKEEFLNDKVVLNINKKWMINIIGQLLCGDFDYIYDKRDEMRSQKGKSEKGPPKRQRMFCCMEGGTPY